MISVFIALGSNLENPARQLRQAVASLADLPQTELLAVSAAYRSRAIGPGPQPDYLNAVAQLETNLMPLKLLDALQRIEDNQGRNRTVRWGARTLDLDILLYGHEHIRHPRLEVPHPRMPHREFVLYPLAELVGEQWFLPGGPALAKLLTQCRGAGLEKADLILAPVKQLQTLTTVEMRPTDVDY